MEILKTVIIQEPFHVEVADRPIPTPGQGEALLRVLYCGFCGSDVASYTGNQPFTSYPRIPGHEFSAQIVTVPENAQGLKTGDIVTGNPYFNCGTCYACRRGYVNCCMENQTMGVQRDGTFQEYITMPVERIYHGQGLDPRILALAEPFCIGYHGVQRCPMRPGDKVLVVGGGPIGIFAMLSAKARGAEVYVCDVLDGRLALAQTMGAYGVCNTRTGSLAVFGTEVTGGNGFDVCIEACGLPETFLACIDQAAFAGNLVLIGNGKRETTFLHSLLLKKELAVFGSRNALQSDFETVIGLLAQGAVDLRPLISRDYTMDTVQEGFETLCHNDGTVMKALLRVTQSTTERE